MSAYLTYEINGEAYGLDVSVQIRAMSKPSKEAAEWLIREKYPSARNVTVTIPAAHKYPAPIIEEPRAATMATTPLRRMRSKRKEKKAS